MDTNNAIIVSLRQPQAANVVFSKLDCDATLTNLPKGAPKIEPGQLLVIHAGYESPVGYASPGSPHTDLAQVILGVVKVDKVHQTRAMIALRLKSQWGAMHPSPYHMTRSIVRVADLPQPDVEIIESAVDGLVSPSTVRMNLNGPASLNPTADGWTGD